MSRKKKQELSITPPAPEIHIEVPNDPTNSGVTEAPYDDLEGQVEKRVKQEMAKFSGLENNISFMLRAILWELMRVRIWMQMK